LSLYETLLSVAVEHSYNSSGVCSSLNFRPTGKTRSIAEKAGLLLRKTLDGIQIVYDRDRLDALEMIAQDRSEPLSFDFRVSSSDTDFRSYSEPYSDDRNEILYFDNRSARGSGRQSISTSERVSEKDFRAMDSAEINEILSHKERLLPPEFVLKIYADNDDGPLLKQWLGQPPTIYSISFDSRQRYWKYYLLGKMVNGDRAQHRFSVVDPDNKFEFETTGQELLSGQRLAFTFRSKQRIPLYEHYPFRFQLRQNGEAGESTVIPSLPVASAGRIGSDAIADQEIIVSEIYINS